MINLIEKNLIDKSDHKKEFVIGWCEWCSLPELDIPAIKVKVDSGAKTSALHAYNLETFTKDGRSYVRFELHPLQKNDDIIRTCELPIVDERMIKSSNGLSEKRYIVETIIQMGDRKWRAQITLTNRDLMTYRMLLGREAMSGIVVKPSMAFLKGHMDKRTAIKKYEVD